MKIFNSYSDREVKRVKKIVAKINKLDKQMESLSDEELQAKTQEFKDRYNNGEKLDSLLVEAFAVCREASKRVLGMKHFDVQLIGGIVIHQGRIAEMKTGEGKTLTETCPAYLNAITGQGVHIVTVNDYLAQRDRELMKPLYDFLGVTSGVVINKSSAEERRNAYNADITYITNNELGFDYLKDNLVKDSALKVQRCLNFAIVDEVDSILIDEARTPLIISGAGEKPSNLYKIVDLVVKSLNEDDYKIDEKEKTVILTETGVEKVEKFFGIENFSDLENFELRHHVSQSLKANYSMKKNIDYIPKNNQIYIVDEFTGRVMEGRRYSDGLHQCIEAKEGVEIKPENKTLASITYQNLFRIYNKLSGMTGTALTEENEFRETYNLDVVVIPTNKPVKRKDNNDKLFSSHKAKVEAIIKDVIETYKKGQPILIGTSSIQKSEELSELLTEHNIPHTVLNAKFHEKEAEIVANAGQKGSVTIATNMAGRGTDIKLGEGVTELGGLKVIGTERADNRRIDNQLIGRSGRQGDPGESIFYLSFEDDLLRIFSNENVLNSLEHSLKRHGVNDVLLQNKFFTKRVSEAQKRIEGFHFESRKSTMKYDSVINKQREIIYAERNEVLESKNLIEDVENVIKDGISEIVLESFALYNETENNEDFDNGLNDLILVFKDIFNIKKEDFENSSVEDIIQSLSNAGVTRYNEIKSLYTEEDFTRTIKNILLNAVDSNWMEYLEVIEHMRQSSQLASFKQQDPVEVFTLETSEVFNAMTTKIKKDTVYGVLKIEEPLHIEGFVS